MAVYSQHLESPSNDQGGLDSAGVATFISKVWKIVENPEYASLICWSDSGKTFIVHNYPQFAKEILPLYFKHSNFNSFVRQLNLYGFRKVAKPDQGSLSRAQNNEPVEFWHTNFRRGHPEVLQLVQRKSVTSRTGVEEKSPHLSKVISDIHQMKGRQESIAGVLDTIKQDNEHLRRDLALLKEKHMRQQRVLNRVIQFLVHMVYKGKLPGNRRRSSRLMLLDGESHPPSPSKRMRTLDDTPLGIDITDISAYSVESPLSAIQSISSLSSVPSPPSDPSVASATPVIITPSLETSLPTTPTSSSQPQQSVLPISSSVSASLSPTMDTLVGSDAENSLQNIPNDLLAEFALSPPPTSLLPNVSDKMCINGHLDQQQLGLDALPDLLSGQFSVNPSIITDFISTDVVPIPEYDAIDTARLLEFLTSDNDTDTVHANNTALVPFSATPYSTPFLLNESSDIVQVPLNELLEGVPTNPASTDPALDN